MCIAAFRSVDRLLGRESCLAGAHKKSCGCRLAGAKRPSPIAGSAGVDGEAGSAAGAKLELLPNDQRQCLDRNRIADLPL